MDVELKTALEGIAETVKGFGNKQTEMQRQLDAINLENKGGRFVGGGEDLLLKAFEDSTEFARFREIGKGRATIKLDLKTLITSSTLGSGTAGVLMPERVGGIVPLAQRRFFLRDLFDRGNRVSGNSAFFIQEATFTNNASPQQEASPKGESANTFTTRTNQVVTIANWLPTSRQIADDLPQLLDFVKRKLLYGLKYREDLEILSGDNLGAHMSGVLPSATAFNTALLASGDTKIDKLRKSLTQLQLADEVAAGFFVLNPVDWSGIELIKDEAGGTNKGRYIYGDPGASGTSQTLWGLPCVVTTAIAQGTFLTGSSDAAELFTRMDSTLEVSTEHSDFFVRNLLAILVECREVLCIYRPGAFITGAL